MKHSYLVGLVAVLATTSFANADIVGWNCAADGDGAVIMNGISWEESTYTLLVNETQYWGPAHVEGDFTTDTDLDPIVWIRKTVENDTTFDWTDYHLNIYMNKPFTILDAYVEPTDWTWVVTQPEAVSSTPNGGGPGYHGAVDYFAGTPVPIGGFGEYDVKVSFAGSIAFCVEQIPTPEPSSMILLALGGLLIRRPRRA